MIPLAQQRQRDLIALAAYYFLSFAALGGLFPFLPIFLTHRGLTPEQISWVMLLVPLTGLSAPAAWGIVADALGARTRVLRIATVGAAFSVLALGPAYSLPEILVAMGLFCIFRAPLVTLADAKTHALLGAPRERFARTRVWGSLGFGAAALIVGQLGGPSHVSFFLGANAALYLLAAATLRPTHAPSLAPSSGLPEERDAPQSVSRAALLAVGNMRLTLTLGATFVYYSAHAAYDVYYTLHLQRLGFDSGFVGLSWAIGVLFEIAVMLVSPALLRARPAALWLTLSALVASARWWLLSWVRSPWSIAATQTLHGITFGLWYLALVKRVQDRSPERLRASLQGLAMTALGVGQAVGYLVGGALFSRGGLLLFRVASVTALISAGLYGLVLLSKTSRDR